jgi:catechol 2,3-dioxygenase-like lactoylglutathione lyase family enzyme
MSRLATFPAIATVAVKELALVREFYEEKLGFVLADEHPGMVTYTSGNSTFFVYEAPSGGSNPASSITWMVEDITVVIDELKSSGVVFEHYEDMPVEWQGDVAVMGPVKSAWFKDPDGNTLAIVEA